MADPLLKQIKATRRALWMAVKSAGGEVIIEAAEIDQYPGDDIAHLETRQDPLTGAIHMIAGVLTKT